MAGLVVMEFFAAAVGLAVAIALVRSLTTKARTIGNFSVDVARSILRVLLPIAVPVAILLVGLGTVQNLHGYRAATTLEGATQLLPGGPVATQVVMKRSAPTEAASTTPTRRTHSTIRTSSPFSCRSSSVS